MLHSEDKTKELVDLASPEEHLNVLGSINILSQLRGKKLVEQIGIVLRYVGLLTGAASPLIALAALKDELLSSKQISVPASTSTLVITVSFFLYLISIFSIFVIFALREESRLQSEKARIREIQRNTAQSVSEAEAKVIAFERATEDKIRIANLTLKDLERQNLVDPLTGTWNLQRLLTELDSRIVNRQSFSGILIDIDHFNLYNREYGFRLASKLLQQVSSVIKGRGENDITGRYGGDEFLIITDAVGDSLIGYSDRIQKTLKDRQFEIGSKRDIKLSCCISFKEFNPANDDRDRFLDALWEDMLTAKACRSQAHSAEQGS